MTETLRQFFDACHPFGYPLLLCSVALVAAIFYHLFFRVSERELRRLGELLANVKSESPRAVEVLQEHCLKHPGSTAAEISYVLKEKENPALPSLIESRLRLLVDSQRCGMTTISIVTSVAPMLGILGTAWGLVDIFGVFGQPGAEAGIALGISKALYTTIFGLAIAVPGIIAQACFERTLERRATLIDELFTDLLANRNKL
jgi:biopolymer transport protein ExbB/TolQ